MPYTFSDLNPLPADNPNLHRHSEEKLRSKLLERFEILLGSPSLDKTSLERATLMAVNTESKAAATTGNEKTSHRLTLADLDRTVSDLDKDVRTLDRDVRDLTPTVRRLDQWSLLYKVVGAFVVVQGFALLIMAFQGMETLGKNTVQIDTNSTTTKELGAKLDRLTDSVSKLDSESQKRGDTLVSVKKDLDRLLKERSKKTRQKTIGAETGSLRDVPLPASPSDAPESAEAGSAATETDPSNSLPEPHAAAVHATRLIHSRLHSVVAVPATHVPGSLAPRQ